MRKVSIIMLAAVAAIVSIALMPSKAKAQGPNLILNPSVEISGSSNLPQYWSSNSWGINTSIFTYPVAGFDGDKAAKVEITSYTDGDAKWYFNDVAVVAGEEYVLSDYYTSNIESEITARYQLSNSTYQYAGISVLPAAASWQEFSTTLTIPVNVVSMTVFHLIYGVGFLTVDNYSLTLVNPEDPDPDKFNQGMVTLTFDDGWFSQYENGVPALNSANLKGTFFIVTEDIEEETVAEAGNLILNPSLESGLSEPDGWYKNSWGSNTSVFTYPVAGFDGDKAAKVEITSYTDGDAKWFFADVAVVAGEEHNFSNYYISTIESEIDIRYLLSNGTYQYVGVERLPTAASWQKYEYTFIVPQDVVSLTFFHIIDGVGSLTVDNFFLPGESQPGENQLFMNASQIIKLQTQGHEIGSHTQTHPHLTSLSPAQAQAEIVGARNDLLNLGATPVNVFSYPYGEYNSTVKQIVIDAGNIGARSVESGYNTKSTDKYVLRTQTVGSDTTSLEVKTWIDSARENKTWLILMFHKIDHSGYEYGTTPEIMQEIADYLATTNTSVITMGQGIGLMNP